MWCACQLVALVRSAHGYRELEDDEHDEDREQRRLRQHARLGEDEA
jgi:hypothetical protein